MAKIDLIGAFKDPVRRPRSVIWTGVVLIGLIAFVMVALYVTSTRWFCAQVCHKVQDDAIVEYERSSHSEISCLACHMPVSADPITFLIHKAEAGIFGGIHTVGNVFVIPLNGASVLAMEEKKMGERQCTQCHSANRKFTPSPGIIIDHKAHEEKGVWCTLCHNRVAHPEEGVTMVTKDPQSGKLNPGHPNFMKMDYCFRCHVLEGNEARNTGAWPDWKASGACPVCHTPGFELKPPSHKEKAFYPKGHAELAKKDWEKRQEEAKEAEKLVEEGIDKQLAEPVGYCQTCHVEQKFCNACHGMEMPHSEEFKTKKHPEEVKTKLAKCVMCHGANSATHFCDSCHHGTKSNWTFDAKSPWINQHAKAVSEKGFDQCLGACHEQKFCYDCHTARKPFPTSHKARTWLHRGDANPWVKDVNGQPNKALHAQGATNNIKGCEICHGAGGPNAKFCRGCHKLEMAHPATFKEFHAKTGRQAPQVCRNCHQFAEICSNCHHKDSSLKASWIKLHGPTVYKNGDGGCFEKCHKQDFCIACHAKRKPFPSTHRAKKWTRDFVGKALHTTAYTANPAGCAYCHGKEAPATNRFCLNCHKLVMPHPSGFKDTHKADFAAKKVNHNQCWNCHQNSFCNGCHHKYTGSKPWRFQHDDVVKATDPNQCFKCHKETYCSHCHVRLIH